MPDNPAEPATDPASTIGEQPAQAATTDWEAEARKWERRSKDNLAKLKEAEPKLTEYERMVEASKTDAQRQADELNRWQSEADTWRKAAIGSRIEAFAATEFADPSDAVSALDPSKYLDAGGQINEAAIKADLAAVLERKPHWRRPEGAPVPRVPAPNPAQGSGGGRPASDPAQEFAAILQGQIGP